MIEKVNPAHPDKIADRIAGAIVDLAYEISEDPRIAVEVMIGHGHCVIMMETGNIGCSAGRWSTSVKDIVNRIADIPTETELIVREQDRKLAENEKGGMRCGDNGIFKGIPITPEEYRLACYASKIYGEHPYDGKYILDHDRLIICQSHCMREEILQYYPEAEVNPLGYWEGGTNVDIGASNRKLGSDMGWSISGGGLHGKDLTKADITLNIYAHELAQVEQRTVEISCAIGDEKIGSIPYIDIMHWAKEYIDAVGGFEKFAEWGFL